MRSAEDATMRPANEAYLNLRLARGYARESYQKGLIALLYGFSEAESSVPTIQNMFRLPLLL